MYELLPEVWPSQKATEEGTSKHSNRSTAKKWVQKAESGHWGVAT